MAGTSAQQIQVFTLGADEYALPRVAVRDIVRAAPHYVACDDPWIGCLIGAGGTIIPLFDLGERLGLDGGPRADGEIVIGETAAGHVGVTVDEVREVLTVTADQLELLPVADAGTKDAIATVDDREIVLLNPRRLFGVEEGTGMTSRGENVEVVGWRESW